VIAPLQCQPFKGPSKHYKAMLHRALKALREAMRSDDTTLLRESTDAA
jgi:hypothetical protein